MQTTRILAAIAFLSVAGAAHADWPFLQNNQIDDFTVRGDSAPDASQLRAGQPGANVPACCVGMRAEAPAPAPAPATPPASGVDYLNGESAG